MISVPSVFDPDYDLEFVRDVALSPQVLFQGWTDPQLLPQWFCPRPWKVIECAIDLRPGGLFANTMQGPDGQTMPRGEGIWLCVEPFRRLVWTNFMGPDFRPKELPAPAFAFVCDLTFEAQETGLTRYRARVMHTTKEGKARHEAMGFQAGWGAALQQLVDLKKESA